jgi:flagellar biosynthesis/type III secretory pathway M-ring protein FliF/YscJ
VASSVPELIPANVTVVDQAGNLISELNKNGNANQNAKNMNETQLKYVKDMQAQVIRQVESIIIPIVGEGNVRAEATADVDFAQIEQAAETYKPNSPPAASAIRSQQSSETSGSAGSNNPNGIPGALSNQPPGTATAPLNQTAATGSTAPAPGTPPGAATGTTGSTGPTHKESTTNYEVDKTVRYEQRGMGGLRRLTVAVVVNHKRIVGKDGKVTVKAYTPEEMGKINDLVKQAMGYNQDRGDAVSVANAPFEGWIVRTSSRRVVARSGQPAAGQGLRQIPHHRHDLAVHRAADREADDASRIQENRRVQCRRAGAGRAGTGRGRSGGRRSERSAHRRRRAAPHGRKHGTQLPRKPGHGEETGDRRPTHRGQHHQGMDRRK